MKKPSTGVAEDADVQDDRRPPDRARGRPRAPSSSTPRAAAAPSCVATSPTTRRASSSSSTAGPRPATPPVAWWRLAVIRMAPFATAVEHRGGDRLAVLRLKNRVRGWNGERQDPLTDARWALDRIRHVLPGVPIVLVGHSMGGRVALRLAAEPDVVGVAALAPWVESDSVQARPGTPVLLAHGSRDRITDPRRTALARLAPLRPRRRRPQRDDGQRQPRHAPRRRRLAPDRARLRHRGARPRPNQLTTPPRASSAGAPHHRSPVPGGHRSRGRGSRRPRARRPPGAPPPRGASPARATALLTPLATPDIRSGAAARTAAVSGETSRASPSEKTTMPGRTVSHEGESAAASRSDGPGGAEQGPDRHRHPRTGALGQRRGSARQEHEGDGDRQARQPGLERGPAGRLQLEDDEQRHPAEGSVDEQGHRVGRREHPVAEHREVDHRVGGAPLDDDEGHRARRGDHPGERHHRPAGLARRRQGVGGGAEGERP